MQSDHSVEQPDAHDVAADVETHAVAVALDLDGIGQDLADVEAALARLDAGTYWVDEITGATLSEDHLGAHPTARRSPAG